MDHAQTIAMATDLLADGRAEDVAQMVEPLMEPVEAPATSTGQLLLRARRAQIEVVHRDRPERALELLPSLSTVDDLCTCVRAEVALWRGWARARKSSRPAAAVQALHRLQHAEDLFDSIHDPRGRCWALLGRSEAYLSLDEYSLLRRTLDTAGTLAERLGDHQAERWLHELSIPALRTEGRYDAVQRHLQALRSLGRDWNDRRIRGHATAYEAVLRFDLGRSPAEIVDTAETAEALLRQLDAGSHDPLRAAYHAHAGALLRRGDWAEASAVLDEAEAAVRDEPADQAPFRVLRSRIALRRDDVSRAEDLLADLLERAESLPHGVHRAPLALLRGEILAHQNRLDDASLWMRRAHRNAQETGHRGHQLQSLLMMARTAAAQSDMDAARSHLDAADEYTDYFSVLPFTVRRFATEGAIAQTAARPEDATEAYRFALAAASMMQDRYRTASLQLALAQLEEEGRAHALASAARSTFDALGADDEATVATALADGAAPPEEEPSSLLHPASALSDVRLGTIFARASLSVPLVANTWLQMAAARLPDRWLGVYRLSADGTAPLLHEHGVRPDGVTPPSRSSSEGDAGSVRWLHLGSSAPSLCLGVEVEDPDDPDWTAARAHIREWRPVVRLALERALLSQRPAPSGADERVPSPPVDGVVAESEAMQALLRRLHRLQSSPSPVLISGERGTGKRTLARALHAMSARADGPLRRFACANMQREPLADRLFGRLGADGTMTPGAAHEADGGTLLIEDVDALPATAQDALLRLLETGEVVPEGGTAPVPVDVRVLATTAASLDEKVRDGHVRPELRGRLSILSLRVPPLRERRADIPLLVRHFLDTLRSDQLKNAAEAPITQPAMEALLRYDWPGNVRQLRNELERALVHVENEPVQTIDRTVLLDEIVEAAQAPDAPSSVDAPDAILRPDHTLNDVLSNTEAAVIKRVLRACDGQVTASAEVLGLSRQGLYKKMKRLGIDASDFHPETEPAVPSS